MPDVARDQDKIVNERRCRDLLVERILGMRHSRTAPNLGRVRVKSKNTVTEVCEQPAEPAFKQLRLLGVASITHEFHAASQLADGHRSEIERRITRRRLFEKGDHPWVCRILLGLHGIEWMIFSIF